MYLRLQFRRQQFILGAETHWQIGTLAACLPVGAWMIRASNFNRTRYYPMLLAGDFKVGACNCKTVSVFAFAHYYDGAVDEGWIGHVHRDRPIKNTVSSSRGL
jgi:hypothetical protein